MSGVKRWKRPLFAVGAFLVFIFLWYLAVLQNPSTDFPGPKAAIGAFLASFSTPIGRYTLLRHILFSLSRVMVGYVFSGLAGICFGLLLAQFICFRALFKPLFDLLRAIPPIAWIPLVILGMGVGETAKYFLIFIAGFVPFTLNTYAGAVRVDPDKIGAALVLGASQRQTFWKVILPATVPYMFSGAQIALSSCWMAVIAAEMLKSTEGVGWIITAGSNYGNYELVCVGMIAIAIVGFILVNFMQIIERKLLRWNMQGT